MSTSGAPGQIHKVLALAKRTFARIRAGDGERKRVLAAEDFAERLNDLSREMNALTADDLGLLRSPAARGEVPPSAAPVTYIGVREEEDFTLGVFVVNPGRTMPLHDHPNMNGCLKVLQGSVEVQSFDRISLSDLEIPEDLPAPLKTRTDLVEKEFLVPSRAPAVLKVTPESKPLLVHPGKDNLHQIRSVGTVPAAFVDALGPPYNHGDLREHGDSERRECTFYKPNQVPAGRPPGSAGRLVAPTSPLRAPRLLL